jgi:hypothetical protein
MLAFSKIRNRAAKRKGGEAVLERLLGTVSGNAALVAVHDDRVLSAMTQRVFSAGFVWRVIEAKWPGFEEAFLGFEPKRLLFQPEEFWGDLASDKRIVRTDILRIAVAQLNPTVGDIAGNLAKAREARADAARQGADLVLYTELFLAGYPPEDLVLQAGLPGGLRGGGARGFCRDTADGGPGRHHRHAAEAQERRAQFGRRRRRRQGHRRALQGRPAQLRRVRREARLPGRAGDAGAGEFPRRALGIPICEDIWGELGVCETLAESGAEILLVPNGSPYYRGKIDVRHQVVIKQVIETGLPMLYANQLGGQDELVFDGAPSPSMPTSRWPSR